MSATGKSTVLAELARRGHAVVDTDVDGWIVDVAKDDGSTEPMWDEARISALLDEHAGGTLFVAGCVANQGRFYPRFHAVVLLSAPEETLLERLATRTTNDFGKLEITRGAGTLFMYGAPDAHDTRCAVCGSLLFSVVRDGEYVHVAMGSLVDAPSIRPTDHIFVGSKAPWFEITDDLPQSAELR